MKTKTLLISFAAILCLGLLVVAAANSQDDIEEVRDPAFTRLLRPGVPFAHDEHNEKAEIFECDACHHVYEGGELVAGESSEGEACSECHKPEKGNPLPLIRVYHAQCSGCHSRVKRGPVMCSECHVKKN